MRNRWFLLTGLAVALVLAAVVSFYASSSPDGLEKVAADKGIDAREEPHALTDSPFADYGTEGVDDERLSGGLAGVAGVGLTFVLGGAVVLAVRRRAGSQRSADEDAPAASAD